MDTVTYPDQRVAEFIEQHTVPVRFYARNEPRLVDEYLAHWTPNVVIADSHGRVHYRLEGFLPPDFFVAYLSLGAGKYYFNSKNYPQAIERFAATAERHAGTSAAAEALYWKGVASYKDSRKFDPLRAAWEKLDKEYPHSTWALRTQIPARPH